MGRDGHQFNVHSIRKSFLSALLRHRGGQRPNHLNATLEQLQIDDNEPSLTAEEKQAGCLTVLKARSGIYHAALYETPTMRAEKPPRAPIPAFVLVL